jgi:hypothetical protein
MFGEEGAIAKVGIKQALMPEWLAFQVIPLSSLIYIPKLEAQYTRVGEAEEAKSLLHVPYSPPEY